jgi:hypothetical protein
MTTILNIFNRCNFHKYCEREKDGNEIIRDIQVRRVEIEGEGEKMCLTKINKT